MSAASEPEALGWPAAACVNGLAASCGTTLSVDGTRGSSSADDDEAVVADAPSKAAETAGIIATEPRLTEPAVALALAPAAAALVLPPPPSPKLAPSPSAADRSAFIAGG